MSTLTKITTRAKKIRRLHGGTWKAAIKKAGAEYRAGKIKGVRKKTSRKKVIRKVKRLHAAEGKAIRRLRGTMSAGASRGIMGTMSAGASQGIMGVDRKTTALAAAVSGLSPQTHLAHARRKIEHLIGVAEVKKFVAKKKSTKRKIARRIAELKTQFRKLC